MKKTLRVFPILLSLLLLLGHQLVPHLHEDAADEMSFGRTESADFGWLSLVFGLDQGAEHLEHFRQLEGNELQPDLQNMALLPLMALVIPKPITRLQPASHIPFRLGTACGFIARAHQLRGPPSC